MSTQLETRPVVTAPIPAADPPPAEESPVEIVIGPPPGWQWINVRELWLYRELIFFLTWRDVKVRYKQTVLGAAWAVLQPAMMMVVFTIFFSKLGGVGNNKDDYPVFVYAGLLPWTFFAAAIAAAGQSVSGSERLITKIYFPRLSLPFAAAGAAVVDSLIACGLLVVLMAWYQIPPTWNLLLLPVIYLLIIVAALGVGALLAGLHVAYRDFRYVTPFMIQLWMFATPTVYMQPTTGKGGWLGFALALNPMTGLIGAFRAACLGGAIDWAALGVSTAFVAAVFVAGCFYFRRVEDSFADII